MDASEAQEESVPLTPTANGKIRGHEIATLLSVNVESRAAKCLADDRRRCWTEDVSARVPMNEAAEHQV